MNRWIWLVATALSLGACANVATVANVAPVDVASPERIRGICASYGYTVGTAPFDHCMLQQTQVQREKAQSTADKREAARQEMTCLNTDDNAPGCSRK